MHGWFLTAGLAAVLGFAPATAQSFDEALALAEFSNPSLEVGRRETEIAREALEEARSQGRVSVTVSGSAGYESIDSNRTFSFSAGDRPIGNATIEASRPIYTGGRVAAGIRAAEAGVAAANADLTRVRQELYLETILAYLDVRAGRETLAIRENNVRLLEEQLDAAEARFRVGFITRTDVALTQARLAGAVAGVAAAQANLEGVAADFQAVTGVRPGELGPVPPTPILPPDFDTALTAALDENPQLRSARENVQAAAEAVEAAEAQGRLQLEIVGSAGGQQEFDQDIYDTEVRALARGSLTLFQGGRIASQVRSAKLEREQARLQVQAAERNIQAGLAAAWYGFIAAQGSAEASARQVEAAEIAFEGAERELSAGTRTTLDVLDSEQDLLDARLSLVNAERDVEASAYQILQLIGGLDRSRILPAPPE